MIRDQPRASDLLKEAKRVLVDTVLPNLGPEARYQALMVIRAIDLVEKERCASLEIEEIVEDQLRQLVSADGTLEELINLLTNRIRNGAFDASVELYDFLRLVVTFKLKETNPSKLPLDTYSPIKAKYCQPKK